MTVIIAAPVPESQIKVRWREPYVSEGVNTALGVLDPGVYRGGYVTATSPATQVVQIGLGGEADSSYLWQDLTTGVALAVRYTAAVSLDCSMAFPVPGGGSTLYVYLDCTYATSATTTATFTVADAAAASANAIPLATITVPFGATTITAAMINVGVTARQAVALERPVALRTYASKTATASGTPLRFQLTGKVLVNGSIDQDQVVRMSRPTADMLPLDGTDGGLLTVAGLYSDSACTTPVVSDSEGFATDPYVKIDTALTTVPPTSKALYAWYYTRATARDLDLTDDAIEMIALYPHAQATRARHETGTPTSLAGDTVGEQLIELLAAVNGRIASMAPTAAPSGPVLLWRSHAIATDAAVTGTTTSLYWGTALGLAMVTGAYLDGGTIYEATVSPADAVSMVRVSANIQASCGLFTKANGFTSFAWDTMASWDSYVRNGELAGTRLWDIASTLWLNNGAVLLGTTSTLGLTNHNNYLYGNRPGASGLHTYCKLFESAAFASSVERLRVFYADNGTLAITSNCRWENSGSWMADIYTSDAWMLKFTATGLALLRKDQDTTNYALGWNDTMAAPGWDSALSWNGVTDRLSVVPFALGAYVDSVEFAVGQRNNTAGNITAYGVQGVTWHAELDGGAALTTAVTKVDQSPGTWSATVLRTDIVGAVIEVESATNAIGAGLSGYCSGIVTVTN